MYSGPLSMYDAWELCAPRGGKNPRKQKDEGLTKAVDDWTLEFSCDLKELVVYRQPPFCSCFACLGCK